MSERCKRALRALEGFAQRRRLPLGALLALLLAGALALHNVSGGPLGNLNDIGGWNNRLLFIVMAAAVHLGLLLSSMCLFRVSPARTALRMGLLTAGMYILLLPINQKTYAFTQWTLPAIRAMEAVGLAAGLQASTPFSAPALTLLYAITRGPVYPMYTVKLLCIGCMLALSMLLVRAADRRGLGLRADALLALCMILPQGFMNAACSALMELPALALLAVSLTLLLDCGKPHALGGALCYGAACALSGVCLYALPVYICIARRGGMKARDGAAALAVMLIACLPAAAGGAPLGETALSLLRANLGTPTYAAGAPNMMSLIPRAQMEEIPQYASALRHLSALDAQTNAQKYYTQQHAEIVMRGITLAGLALYVGLCALLSRAKDKPALHRAMALALGALIVCPNATSAAWLALDLLCLYAVLSAPGLRLPACLVLFATMASGAYPMTEEVMLPMAWAFILCLLALCVLLDVMPTKKEASHV